VIIDLASNFVTFFILLLCSFFFSGSEASIFSLSSLDLEKIKNSKPTTYKTIKELLNNPQDVLVTILLCNEITNILIALEASSIFYNIFRNCSWKFIIFMSVLVTTPIIIFCGEITPKSIALKYPIRFAAIASPSVLVLVKLLTPIRWLVSGFAEKILKCVNLSSDQKMSIKEDEFRTLIEAGKKEGTLEERETKLIHKALDFSDKIVSRVMTKRENIFALPIDMNIDEINELIKENFYSRIPIYKNQLDNIVGILLSKDLLAFSRHEFKYNLFSISKILKPVHFVPINARLEQVFRELTEKKIHLSIVVDEYGRVNGLVTMDDLLAQLFGEIKDAYDIVGEMIIALDNNTYRISSQLPIFEFNKLFASDIDMERFRSLNGFIIHLLGGKLPKKGQFINYKNLKITVSQMQGTKIMELLVQKL
jgi:CBS domain containing-hemolysin-like protein